MIKILIFSIFTSIYLLGSFLPLKAQTDTYVIRKTGFSTERYDEFSPVYYKNGLVFCSDREHGLLNYSDSADRSFMNIYYVDTSELKNPVLFSKEINTKFNEGPVTFDSSMNTIYYTRNLMVEGNMKRLSSRWNKLGLFSAVLKDGEWSRIRDFRLNNRRYNVITPSLSPDGLRLYFASDMPEGYGGTDLYYSEWKNGYWNMPVNMGEMINTAGNEAYPYINAKGEFFFSSDGHPGMGGKDIFLSLHSDTGFSKPILLDPPVNSKYEDFGFLSDNLMIEGYFSSNRDKSVDIYHFTTRFPQVFDVNYQRENILCFTFEDTGTVEVDTSLLDHVWYWGDGKSSSGIIKSHCFPDTGTYPVHLDIENNGDLFFRKMTTELKVKEYDKPRIQSPQIVIKGNETGLKAIKPRIPGYSVTGFAWEIGNGTRKTGPEIIHSFQNEGEYEVHLFITLRSDTTKKTTKKAITRKIRVVGNELEKEFLEEETSQKKIDFINVKQADNAELLNYFSAEKEQDNETIFCVEIFSSTEELDLKDSVFRNLPNKYILKKWYDDEEQMFSYTIMQQKELMHIFPSWLEIRKAGFENAQAKLFPLKDPAEKDLYSLLNDYDTSVDAFFFEDNQLSENARIILDEIANILKKNPGAGLEVSVHTDNQGFPSENLASSQLQAKKLTDFLVTKGIERERLITWGYGAGKPIASNETEEGRRLNRRVEFTILK